MYSDSGKNGGGMHEVNVVPLIDVSLVLVVILMLLTPLASESNIAVHRTHAADPAETPPEPAEPVLITIPDEADVILNRARIARAELSAALEPLLVGLEPPPVIVSCDDGVSHGAFVNVLDQAKLCGAKEIAVTEGVD